ncbi:MAG: DNA translocase FtsK [Chloroflexota bacterium]|nr:DNA translocase FtsK [Chloroflexota bacterium]
MSKKPARGSSKARKGGKSKPSQRGGSWREALVANSEVITLILLLVGGLLLVDFFTRQEDSVGIVSKGFGWAALPALLALMLASLGVLIRQTTDRLNAGHRIPWRAMAEVFVGLLLLLLAAIGLSHLWADSADPWEYAKAGQGGGVVGWLAGSLPASLLGDLITTLLLVILAGLGVWIIMRPLGVPALDPRSAVTGLRDSLRSLLPEPREQEISDVVDSPQPAGSSPPVEPVIQDDQDFLGPSIAVQETVRPKRKRPPRKTTKPRPIKPKPRPDYLPSLDLLAAESQSGLKETDIEYKKQMIEETLASFNVPVTVVDVNVGPAVTQFGVKPGEYVRRGADGEDVTRRVRVSRIKSLSNDLALALEAPTLRIEAPVPGKGYVGIEVPNSATNLVGLREVLESQSFLRLKSPLAFAVGRDVAGEPVAADLATMPHLLIAGATGSGKSVCINSLIASLLFNNGPDQLRLLLIDPKRVELLVYEGVPHLLAPVVTDLDQMVGAFTWLMLQMDERYRNFSRVGARNLDEFNRKVSRKKKPKAWQDLDRYPSLVLVIDELADLMLAAPDRVERQICRLAQMARATGIHLVISTQRPSVDVVTGLIKANFPARIAFSVTSQTDSRVILDSPGSEKLLGSGDMLFMRPDSSKLDRVQGCFVSDKEIERLVRFWKESMPAEELAANVPRYPWTGLMAQLEDHDEQYEQALDVIQGVDRASISWLQRRLRVGYNRAAELMAKLEADGYVGPDEGAGRGREVLLASDDDEQAMWG